MKIVLVHDYLKEYGGAERVLEALSEVFPDAPIYTSFYQKDSIAYQKFKNKDIRVSWVHYIPFFASKLHSPLRFLAPLIWSSFDFSSYDAVITSAGWYVTKGLIDQRQKIKDKRPIEICYCHTPPRWLYGYKTSVEWQRYWPIRVYAAIVGHFMRMYDFRAAQRVDYFIANSEETKKRIAKFYRREATVIYPPVSLPKEAISNKRKVNKDYYFMVARIVGAKGIELAVKASQKMGFTLKIAGVPGGYYSGYKNLSSQNVEFLGYVTDEELVNLYSGAKAFLALATDEDFGITPVEAMLCGTPVVAYRGGGYVESVIEARSPGSGQGSTGVFFNEPTVESLLLAIEKLEKSNIKPADCIAQAKKFSKERFKKEIKEFINAKIKTQNAK